MCDNVHMISSQRQHLILSRLRTRGAVRITALSKELGVSAMTIRRDIADLSDKGLLKRVHGGAVSTSALLSEPLFSVKSQMDIGLKDAIAREAVQYVAPGDVTHEMRRRAKAVNFGIVYGISPFSLSQDIGVTVAEAKDYMEAYFASFPGVKAYMEAVVAKARENGYVETLFHRRRDLPELKSSNFNLRSFGERVALNMPIQGTAADIMKLAMVAVEKRLKKELPEAKLVLQVHDELIVECPEDQAAAAAKLLEEEMEQVAHLSVPLTAEAHWGRNWLEAKG